METRLWVEMYLNEWNLSSKHQASWYHCHWQRLPTKWLGGGNASHWQCRARITGSTVEGTKYVCEKAHIALRAMENHPCILSCTKGKKRSHHLGHLPIIHSTAKEKQAKATIVVWVSVEKERKREKREASSC
jgi:hypothetical protein